MFLVSRLHDKKAKKPFSCLQKNCIELKEKGNVSTVFTENQENMTLNENYQDFFHVCYTKIPKK